MIAVLVLVPSLLRAIRGSNIPRIVVDNVLEELSQTGKQATRIMRLRALAHAVREEDRIRRALAANEVKIERLQRTMAVLEKWAQVSDFHCKLAEFTEWLEQNGMAMYIADANGRSLQDLVMAWANVDPAELERERRALLQAQGATR